MVSPPAGCCMRRTLVLVAMLAGCRTAPARAQASDESLIRAARAHNNRAIAAHDTAALASDWMPEFWLVSSTNAQTAGRDAARSRFAQQFALRPDLIYVRE